MNGPVVLIIQARMTSTRLPGKVLLPIAGRPALEHTVRRAREARRIDRVGLAVSTRTEDDTLVAWAGRLEVPVVRGSESDVLDRYAAAARAWQAGTVVRVTGDCPFIDPEVIDRVVAELAGSGAGDGDLVYASNTLRRTWPQGLDVEAFTRAALETAWAEAAEPAEREHVTPWLYRHPERVRLIEVTSGHDHSHRRWTLDEPDDYRFFEAVAARLPCVPPRPTTAEVLALLEAYPEIEALNARVQQKQL